MKVVTTEADLGGGALHVKSSVVPSTMVMDGTTFSSNKAGYCGGSLIVDTVASLKISGTTFDSSNANAGSGKVSSFGHF